jgi:hypothetical protein
MMRVRIGLAFFTSLAFIGCGDTASSDTDTSTDIDTSTDTDTSTDSGPDSEATADGCGHDVFTVSVQVGFNEVLGSTGSVKPVSGMPLQEGDTLAEVTDEITANNRREHARIASYMMPIRDALMCDFESTSVAAWDELTEILVLNDIKTAQDLSGTPMEQVYSTDGIYEHLLDGEDEHPMMKYLEEAELELKCLAFTDFDLTNPAGDDHCEIHSLDTGSGLFLPAE